MKAYRSGILSLMIILASLVPRSASQAADWRQIPIPALSPFHPQEPKRIELPNGMVVFLQEDHELPIVDGTARVRGGSRSEPANKVGLVDIYGEVWRTGGTKSQTGDQLDDYLEIRAAKVETNGGVDSTHHDACHRGHALERQAGGATILQPQEIRFVHRRVAARCSCLFATGYLGKVVVREFLPRRLLGRRSLTNHQYVLTYTIRTAPAGTSADQQRDARHPAE